MVLRRAPNAKALRVAGVDVTTPVSIDDRVITDASGAQTIVRVTVANVPTYLFPTGIARHVTATVGSTTYTVRDARETDDGEYIELLLAEVAS